MLTEIETHPGLESGRNHLETRNGNEVGGPVVAEALYGPRDTWRLLGESEFKVGPQEIALELLHNHDNSKVVVVERTAWSHDTPNTTVIRDGVPVCNGTVEVALDFIQKGLGYEVY